MSGLLGIGLSLVLSGCNTTGSDSISKDRTLVTIGAATGDEKTVTRTIECTAGSTVEIALRGSSGTGYTWTMTAHSEGISLEDAPVTKPLKAGTPGGPTVTTFNLSMKKSGRQTARLELARTWEADTPAARVVDLVFTVSEKP